MTNDLPRASAVTALLLGSLKKPQAPGPRPLAAKHKLSKGGDPTGVAQEHQRAQPQPQWTLARAGSAQPSLQRTCKSPHNSKGKSDCCGCEEPAVASREKAHCQALQHFYLKASSLPSACGGKAAADSTLRPHCNKGNMQDSDEQQRMSHLQLGSKGLNKANRPHAEDADRVNGHHHPIGRQPCRRAMCAQAGESTLAPSCVRVFGLLVSHERGKVLSRGGVGRSHIDGVGKVTHRPPQHGLTTKLSHTRRVELAGDLGAQAMELTGTNLMWKVSKTIHKSLGSRVTTGRISSTPQLWTRWRVNPARSAGPILPGAAEQLPLPLTVSNRRR